MALNFALTKHDENENLLKSLINYQIPPKNLSQFYSCVEVKLEEFQYRLNKIEHKFYAYRLLLNGTITNLVDSPDTNGHDGQRRRKNKNNLNEISNNLSNSMNYGDGTKLSSHRIVDSLAFEHNKKSGTVVSRAIKNSRSQLQRERNQRDRIREQLQKRMQNSEKLRNLLEDNGDELEDDDVDDDEEESLKDVEITRENMKLRTAETKRTVSSIYEKYSSMDEMEGGQYQNHASLKNKPNYADFKLWDSLATIPIAKCTSPILPSITRQTNVTINPSKQEISRRRRKNEGHSHLTKSKSVSIVNRVKLTPDVLEYSAALKQEVLNLLILSSSSFSSIEFLLKHLQLFSYEQGRNIKKTKLIKLETENDLNNFYFNTSEINNYIINELINRSYENAYDAFTQLSSKFETNDQSIINNILVENLESRIPSIRESTSNFIRLPSIETSIATDIYRQWIQALSPLKDIFQIKEVRTSRIAYDMISYITHPTNIHGNTFDLEVENSTEDFDAESKRKKQLSSMFTNQQIFAAELLEQMLSLCNECLTSLFLPLSEELQPVIEIMLFYLQSYFNQYENMEMKTQKKFMQQSNYSSGEDNRNRQMIEEFYEYQEIFLELIQECDYPNRLNLLHLLREKANDDIISMSTRSPKKTGISWAENRKLNDREAKWMNEMMGAPKVYEAKKDHINRESGRLLEELQYIKLKFNDTSNSETPVFTFYDDLNDIPKPRDGLRSTEREEILEKENKLSNENDERYKLKFSSTVKYIALRADAFSWPILFLIPESIAILRKSIQLLTDWIDMDKNYVYHIRTDILNLEKKLKIQKENVSQLIEKEQKLDYIRRTTQARLKTIEEELRRFLKHAFALTNIGDGKLEEYRYDFNAMKNEIIDKKQNKYLKRIKYNILNKQKMDCNNLYDASTNKTRDSIIREMEMVQKEINKFDEKERDLTRIYNRFLSYENEIKKLFVIWKDYLYGSRAIRQDRFNIEADIRHTENSIEKLKKIIHLKQCESSISKIFFRYPLINQTNRLNTIPINERSDEIGQAILIIAKEIDGLTWKKLYYQLPFDPSRGSELRRRDISEVQKKHIRGNLIEKFTIESLQNWCKYNKSVNVINLRIPLIRSGNGRIWRRLLSQFPMLMNHQQNEINQLKHGKELEEKLLKNYLPLVDDDETKKKKEIEKEESQLVNVSEAHLIHIKLTKMFARMRDEENENKERGQQLLTTNNMEKSGEETFFPFPIHTHLQNKLTYYFFFILTVYHLVYLRLQQRHIDRYTSGQELLELFARQHIAQH
ncbi:hypothetical protein SNEBB_009919 [Seison nebaliae]|nr:hypothetical protein SNEBB_009919 [Seison nebaliae]